MGASLPNPSPHHPGGLRWRLLALSAFLVGALLLPPPTPPGEILDALVVLALFNVLVWRLVLRPLEAMRVRTEEAFRSLEAEMSSRSQLLAQMSHEIRTPVSGIVGTADLLRDTPLTSEQNGYVDMLAASTDTLLTVVNDILDFSRIEAGRLQLAPQPIALRDLVGGTVRALAVRAEPRGLELAWRVARDVPDLVEADPDRLRQILSNLVDNALKYTQHGEVVVEVTRAAPPAPLPGLRLEVRDTGIGIPTDQLASVFEPFVQGERGKQRRSGGAGLGLAVCARLAALMDGRLEVESTVDRGTTFRLTVPMRPVEGATSPAAPAALEGRRVLIVDDNATSRRFLEELAGERGIAADLAEDAAKAVEMLGGASYDVLLLDFSMPHGDGFATLEALRAQVAIPPAVMLLPATAPAAVARCRSMGMEWVTKPVLGEDLFVSIARACLPSRPAPASRSAESAPPRRHLRLLVAEDNPINRVLLLTLLERQGHRFQAVENSEDAVQAIEEGAFDAALLDVHMPPFDGLEVARRVREREARLGLPRLPLVAVTAHALPGDRERCLEAGMDAYLPKPITMRELTRVLHKTCGGPEVADPRGEACGLPPPMSPFDRATLRVRFRQQGETLHSMFEMFEDELPATLSRLREAAARHDGGALKREAHALTGSLVSFCALPSAQVARDLENAGRFGHCERAVQLLEVLGDEVGSLVESLRAFFAEANRDGMLESGTKRVQPT